MVRAVSRHANVVVERVAHLVVRRVEPNYQPDQEPVNRVDQEAAFPVVPVVFRVLLDLVSVVNQLVLV